jgi:hypothetical protein
MTTGSTVERHAKNIDPARSARYICILHEECLKLRLKHSSKSVISPVNVTIKSTKEMITIGKR